MIRVRIGESWKEDPRVRVALRRATGRSRPEAIRSIVDVVAIEVDGVDIAAGRTEGSLLGAAEGLVQALSRLVAGEDQASVPFQDGAVELLLRRRGPSALLSLVTLSRPARVLAREVEVDLGGLARATREAAALLCRDLAPVGTPPSILRRLLRAAARLARAEAPPDSGPPLPAHQRRHRPRRRRGAPACSFEIRDEEGLLRGYRGPGADLGSLLVPGRVTLRDAHGGEILSAPGFPFLMLRDLAASAARLAAALQTGERRCAVALAGAGRRGGWSLSVDLRAGTLAVDGRAPIRCAPAALAQALLEAALDFCGAAAARNPRQAQNGHLIELRTGAEECLAHLREMLAGDLPSAPSAGVRPRRPPRPMRAPLGHGRTKRLVFRRSWQADVGAPAGEALYLSSGRLLACGGTAALCLDPGTGRPRWRGPGSSWSARAGDLLLLSTGERLLALEVGTGRLRWSRPEDGGPRSAFVLAGGLLALEAGSCLRGLDPANGRTTWTFAPPGAARLHLTGFGSLSVAAADTGLVYGVDGSGRVSWRLRGPGPAAAPPLPHGQDCLALFRTERGASLLALDPSSGRRRWEAPLEFLPWAPPVPFAGLLGLAGAVGGEALVAALGPGGMPAWAASPSLGAGPLSLAALRGGLLARSADGSCAAWDRSGTALWARPAAADHPPPGLLAPRVLRGAVLVPSDGIEVLDETSGVRLGAIPGVAPARLAVADDLSVFALDADGLVTAARLATRLGVV